MGKEFYITFYMKSGKHYNVNSTTAENVTVEDAWQTLCREMDKLDRFRSGKQWVNLKEVEYMEYFVPGSVI